MPKYTFSRRSIVEETFTVIADSESEALDLVMDGAPGVEIDDYKEWIDWYDDEYGLVDTEDELVTFLNEGAAKCGITS
jgi:hypothetical protein